MITRAILGRLLFFFLQRHIHIGINRDSGDQDSFGTVGILLDFHDFTVFHELTRRSHNFQSILQARMLLIGSLALYRNR